VTVAQVGRATDRADGTRRSASAAAARRIGAAAERRRDGEITALRLDGAVTTLHRTSRASSSGTHADRATRLAEPRRWRAPVTALTFLIGERTLVSATPPAISSWQVVPPPTGGRRSSGRPRLRATRPPCRSARRAYKGFVTRNRRTPHAALRHLGRRCEFGEGARCARVFAPKATRVALTSG